MVSVNIDTELEGLLARIEKALSAEDANLLRAIVQRLTGKIETLEEIIDDGDY